MLRINWPEFITKMSVYYSALILPLTIVKVPDPFQRIHPKFIRLNLATWPGQKHCNIHSSLGLRHTRMRLFFSNDEFTFIRKYHTIPITKNYFLESPYYSLLPINYPARIHMGFFVQPVYDIYYETNIFLKKICRFP